MTIHNTIRDDGVQFQIVPNTRKVIVPASHRTIGTVRSHNSEQITFKCPKTIDGHDVANCSKIYVAWVNAKGITGRYDVKKEDITTEAEYMYFKWVIEWNVTASAGSIKFAVHFEDRDAETDALIYGWGTTVCEDCQILDTIIYTNGATVPVPDGYVLPKGTLPIVENNEPGKPYPVHSFAFADVQIPEPSKTVRIEKNGTYDEVNGVSIKDAAKVIVGVPQPEGAIHITSNTPANAPLDVSKFAQATVSVPSEMEEGYIKPEGSKLIEKNGNDIDVAKYATVDVAVPVPELIECTVKDITSYIPGEGRAFNKVNVDSNSLMKVKGDVNPDPIKENGFYPTNGYRKVQVAVPVPDNYFYIDPNNDRYPDTIETSETVNVEGYRWIEFKVPQNSGGIPENYHYIPRGTVKPITVAESGTEINVLEHGVEKIIINILESEDEESGSLPAGVLSITGNYLIENNGKTISLADLIAQGYGSLYIALEEAGNDGEA